MNEKFRPRFLFDQFIEVNSERKEIERVQIIRNKRGDITSITIEPVQVRGVQQYVTRIRRTYKNGEKYIEPDHFWDRLPMAERDAEDWASFAKLTDW